MTPEPLPCPPWCRADHSSDPKLIRPSHIGGPAPSVLLSDAPGASHVLIFVFQRDGEDPYLILSGSLFGGHSAGPALNITLKESEHAARLIEMLADADPARCREVAAALRQSASAARGDR